MNAVTLGEDGSVVMVGNAGEGTQSLSAVKLDAEGELLWAWQVFRTSQATVVAQD